MSKIVLILFTGLTLSSAYLTFNNVGAQQASSSNSNHSVRSGSVSGGSGRVSYGGGK